MHSSEKNMHHIHVHVQLLQKWLQMWINSYACLSKLCMCSNQSAGFGKGHQSNKLHIEMIKGFSCRRLDTASYRADVLVGCFNRPQGETFVYKRTLLSFHICWSNWETKIPTNFILSFGVSLSEPRNQKQCNFYTILHSNSIIHMLTNNWKVNIVATMQGNTVHTVH